MTIGERIRMLRTDNGLSQAVLAEKFEMARMTLVNYENNKTIPETSFLLKAAALFDCSTDYLLGLTNFRNNEEKEMYSNNLKSFEATLEVLPDEYRVLIMCDMSRLIANCSKYENLKLFDNVFEIVGNIATLLHLALPYFNALHDFEVFSSDELVLRNFSQFSTRLNMHQRTIIERIYTLMTSLTEQMKSLMPTELREELQNISNE